MRAHMIRFLIQASFAIAGILAVAFVAAPFGPTLAFFLLVFGLWMGRRVFLRLESRDRF
ncbi:hypothetical protein ABVF61_19010 [Roseibium sp. HPY-6]|uniref:hypothetical protein n=1 Tax=Roseibium sp. HPY-6 TaxID=3229852 RepID=UPI00338FF790